MEMMKRHDEENRGGGGGGGGGRLPPGFRFHPTDEELVTYYLSNKVSDFGFSPIAIADVDLNKCEPWDLPGKASIGEKEWYFFSMKDRKYPTGLRTNRATEAGYWKTTGKDKEIFGGGGGGGGGGLVVGMKKTLVFYRGRAPKGEKTNWVMHEYRLETKHAFKPHKEEWVVCRIFRKCNRMKKHQRASSSSLEPPCVTNTSIANNESRDFGNLNPNTMMSSSSNGGINKSNNTCMQNYYYYNDNNTTHPLLPWPPTHLTSNLSSLHTLLLRALQLRGNNLYQPMVGQNQDTITSKRTSEYTYMSQGLVENTISDFGDVSMDTTSDFTPIETPTTSTFLNSVNNQQQHQQPYKNFTNMW